MDWIYDINKIMKNYITFHSFRFYIKYKKLLFKNVYTYTYYYRKCFHTHFFKIRYLTILHFFIL